MGNLSKYKKVFQLFCGFTPFSVISSWLIFAVSYCNMLSVRQAVGTILCNPWMESPLPTGAMTRKTCNLIHVHHMPINSQDLTSRLPIDSYRVLIPILYKLAAYNDHIWMLSIWANITWYKTKWDLQNFRWN